MEERQGVREFVKAVFRKVGLYPLAAGTLWYVRRIRYRLGMVLRALWPRSRAALEAAENENDGQPRGYDVICLPVISWNSRFQRPQQMMQQFAQRGHRVFYASLEFHGGTAADDACRSGRAYSK